MLPLSTWAQIDVTATAGTPGPTTYSNLRLAFAAVNDGTHQGAITIDITSNPSADNNTAVLNASGSGAAEYTTVLVRPAGTPGTRTISGTINAGPLVDLNGADNVTFDGRNADGYGLTLTNQSAASTAGTSTVRFVGDATGNTLVELILLGRSTGAVGTLCGTVLFGSGSSTGNDGNTISHCTLANDGTTTTDLVAQALVSIGGTANLDLHNSGNVVEHCLIHDFFTPAGSRGIHLGAGNHAWTMANNRFWQGAARTTATNGSIHVVIDISSGSHSEAGGHTITNNVIGFSNASGTGSWDLAGGSNSFRAIRMELGADGPQSTVSGNTIAGIAHATNAAGTGASSPSTLVHVLGGPVAITGNQFGVQGAAGSIVFTPNAGGRDLHVVLNSGDQAWSSHGNQVGGMAVANNSALYALRSMGNGAWSCDSNVVGGTVASSIQATGTGSGAVVRAISSENAALSATGNTIRNLASSGNGGAHIRGISTSGGTMTAQANTIHTRVGSNVDGIHATNTHATITGNTISHLSCTTTAMFSPLVRGVFVNGDTTVVSDNTIHTITNAATGSSAATYGIQCNSGAMVASGNTINGLGNVRYVAGIHAADAVIEAHGNFISEVAARNTDGILVANAMASLVGNHIHTLNTTATDGSPVVTGVHATNGTLLAQGNTIHHLSNMAATPGALARGMHMANTTLTAEGNTVHHISGNGSGTSGHTGVVGIGLANAGGITRVHLRNNILHSLYGSYPDNTGQVHGIQATLNDTTNLIEANLLHGLWRSTSSTAANPARGIHLAAGTSTVRHNMLRLGLDSAGASVNSPHVFTGIQVAGGEHAILHNTVYIGGEATTASSNHSYALLSETTGTRDHRNNILWNARSNSTGSAKHYAVGVNASLSGLVSDHNCLYATGTGGHVGREGTTDRTTLGAWQSATGLDGNSISTDPGLVRPEGDATEVDLHIQHNSAGAAALFQTGATGTGVLHDFDGAQRHSPPDIGADQILLVLPDFYEEPVNRNVVYRRNKGQVADNNGTPQPSIKFYSEGGFPRTYLRDDASFSLVALWQDTLDATPDTTWRVDVKFTGDKVRTTAPQAVDLTGYHHNYYFPWCGPNGAEQVHAFQRVVYEDVFPLTDVHFYSGSGGLKLAFVIRPGGDLENIQLAFDGQDSLTVDPSGFLVAHIGNMSFPLIGGIAYNVDGGTIIPVGITTYLNSAGSPEVDMGMSLFSDPPDPDLPLVILVSPPPLGGGGLIETPGLCWSTYFGGDGQESITASTQDEGGNYFVAGNTTSGETLFPWAPGTLTYGNFGNRLAFVMKMNHLDQMVWRAFLGGDGTGNTFATAVVTKPGNGLPARVYIAGSTNSTSLSTFTNGTAFFQGGNTNGTFRGFVASFQNNDQGQRIWTTYFGEEDLQIEGMAVAGYQRLYITGSVGGALPAVQETPPAGAEDYPFGGMRDAFVAMFNAEDRLWWRTYYGGEGMDEAKEITFANNKIFIAGNTDSEDMIVVDPGSPAHAEPYAGTAHEVFVAEFDIDCVQQWGTCFAADGPSGPGTLRMLGKGLTWDVNTDDVLIGGLVGFQGLPIVPGPGWYDPDKPLLENGGFLARFSGTDRSLIWSTYVCESGMVDIRCVYFDKDGNLYVAGVTRDQEFPLLELVGVYYSEDMYPDLGTQQRDAFVMGFTPGQDLVWSTYFGGEAGAQFEGINTMLLRNNDLYAGGFTSKATGQFGSYFPLHDPDVPEVHFQPLYGDVLAPTTDAFITRFCTSMAVGVPDEPWRSPVRPLTAWQNGDQVFITGLPPGQHRMEVIDATGRMVGTTQAVSDGAQSSFQKQPWADGIYTLVFRELGNHARLYLTR